MSDVNMAPVTATGVTPPMPAANGGLPLSPPSPAPYKPPKKGGLSIGVIAAIQAVYAKEEAKQEKIQGLGQGNLGLKPGWGGQGR